MGPHTMILVFWMLSFKPVFPLFSFTFIKRLFSSCSLSAIRVMSSAYLRLLIFLPAVFFLGGGGVRSLFYYSESGFCSLDVPTPGWRWLLSPPWVIVPRACFRLFSRFKVHWEGFTVLILPRCSTEAKWQNGPPTPTRRKKNKTPSPRQLLLQPLWKNNTNSS